MTLTMKTLEKSKKNKDFDAPAEMKKLWNLVTGDQFKTNLSIYPINKNHVCCDNPKNKNYNKIYINKKMRETEILWRKDSLYNIIIVIGYNDQPVKKGKGSAIFLHLTTNKYRPTQGCIGLHLQDMKKLLSYNPKNIKII